MRYNADCGPQISFNRKLIMRGVWMVILRSVHHWCRRQSNGYQPLTGWAAILAGVLSFDIVITSGTPFMSWCLLNLSILQPLCLCEPPLYIRRRKLSIQYCLKLSSSPQNPTHNTVFNCKSFLMYTKSDSSSKYSSPTRPPCCWFRKKERLNVFNSCYSSVVIKATQYKLQYSLFLQR